MVSNSKCESYFRSILIVDKYNWSGRLQSISYVLLPIWYYLREFKRRRRNFQQPHYPMICRPKVPTSPPQNAIYRTPFMTACSAYAYIVSTVVPIRAEPESKWDANKLDLYTFDAIRVIRLIYSVNTPFDPTDTNTSP